MDERRQRITRMIALGVFGVILVAILIIARACTTPQQVTTTTPVIGSAIPLADDVGKAATAEQFTAVLLDFGWDTNIAEYETRLRRLAPTLTFGPLLTGLTYQDCLQERCYDPAMSVTSTPASGNWFQTTFTTQSGEIGLVLVEVSDYGQVIDYQISPAGDGG